LRCGVSARGARIREELIEREAAIRGRGTFRCTAEHVVERQLVTRRPRRATLRLVTTECRGERLRRRFRTRSDRRIREQILERATRRWLERRRGFRRPRLGRRRQRSLPRGGGETIPFENSASGSLGVASASKLEIGVGSVSAVSANGSKLASVSAAEMIGVMRAGRAGDTGSATGSASAVGSTGVANCASVVSSGCGSSAIGSNAASLGAIEASSRGAGARRLASDAKKDRTDRADRC
jgi:hypothetical protein